MLRKFFFDNINILVICTFSTFLISFPGFVGYFFAPEDYVYIGFDWQDDFRLYASYIKQSAESPKIFMENKFTTENQAGIYVFLYFSLLGIVSNITGISIPIIFNLGRSVVVFIFLFILWTILKDFFVDQKQRTIAFLVCVIGGGIGWFFSLLSVFLPKFSELKSTDLSYALGYSTFGHLAFPLPYIAYSLFFVVFILLKKYFESCSTKFLVMALIFYTLIFFIHPASIAVFSLCLILIPLMPIIESIDFHKAIKYFKAISLFILPAFIILIYLKFAIADFVYSKSLEAYMNWKRSEPLFYFFIGYGALIPLAFFGMRKIQKLDGFVKDFFYAWLLGAFIAAITPQKGVKLMFSLHIPIAISASFGIFYLSEKIQDKKIILPILVDKKINLRSIFVIVTLLFLCLSAPFIIKERLSDVANPNFQSGPYLSKADFKALQFLAKQEKGNVISSYKIGNNIPFLTPHKSFLGHWTETVNFTQKKAIVEKFFSDDSNNEEKKKILREYNITYVFFGENEKMIGDSISELELKKIYNEEGTTIYKVT